MSELIDRRYQRQVMLPEIGEEGQHKLQNSSILVVGAGGLGGAVLQYLAAAGIGRLDIIDGDSVDITNLNRQILYEDQDIGLPKAQQAALRLRKLNNTIKIDHIDKKLTEENASEIISGYSALALCLDSIEPRIAANRACVKAGIKFVEAGVCEFYGIMTTVIPGLTPCYECARAYRAKSPKSIPILGAMAGWVGCAEALAAIRLLLEIPDDSMGDLLYFNGMKMTIEKISLTRNPNCGACGHL